MIHTVQAQTYFLKASGMLTPPPPCFFFPFFSRGVTRGSKEKRGNTQTFLILSPVANCYLNHFLLKPIVTLGSTPYCLTKKDSNDYFDLPSLRKGKKTAWTIDTDQSSYPKCYALLQSPIPLEPVNEKIISLLVLHAEISSVSQEYLLLFKITANQWQENSKELKKEAKRQWW